MEMELDEREMLTEREVKLEEGSMLTERGVKVERRQLKRLAAASCLFLGAVGVITAFPAPLYSQMAELDGSSAVGGGGWTVVRCVSSTQGSWHPATDMLVSFSYSCHILQAGTEAYGSESADGTWSVEWDMTERRQMLLALTDFSLWAIIDKEQLQNYGGPVQTTIAKSSSSDEPYSAEWYLRSVEDCAASTKEIDCGEFGALEDPWASVYDHSATDPGMVYGEDSKTGHLEHLGVDGVGACVWVR